MEVSVEASSGPKDPSGGLGFEGVEAACCIDATVDDSAVLGSGRRSTGCDFPTAESGVGEMMKGAARHVVAAVRAHSS